MSYKLKNIVVFLCVLSDIYIFIFICMYVYVFISRFSRNPLVFNDIYRDIFYDIQQMANFIVLLLYINWLGISDKTGIFWIESSPEMLKT